MGGPGVGNPSSRTTTSRYVLALPVLCAATLLLAAPWQSGARPGFIAAAAVLLAWAAVLALKVRDGAPLTTTVAVYRHHWVQALAQTTVLAYWAWHVRFVAAFLPLIGAQIVFAYGVDSLLAWSRRGRYALGFGPIPVVLSVNLFLWFRPEWFHWQFGLILLGYLGKDLIRWERGGRSSHIFNPSSFPLAVVSLLLIATDGSNLTFGQAIATSQYYPPNMYLLIFLAALPGQVLFGVARMTLPAVVAAYAISVVHLQLAGTYLFYDSHIPVPVFLGMHLLFTDPSTAPRSEAGRVAFGVLYGAMISAFYVGLGSLGVPTFYDKLLPVPILNLMVRRIDALAAGAEAAVTRLAPGRAIPGTSLRRNLIYTATWAVVFGALTAARGVGDRHPGQALPFWWEVCREGNNARACQYAAVMTRFYCNDGSGWACNEVGLLRMEIGRPPGDAFDRSCQLGFPTGCENARRTAAGATPAERSPPLTADLPIVLRGTKQPLRSLAPEELRARACDQGWTDVCGG